MIEATSAAQFAATTDGGVPPLERIAADTWVVALPLPDAGSGTVPYTLCYLLLDTSGSVHLIDPGWGSDESTVRVRAALDELGNPPVASVIATHLHPDHLGLAARLHEDFGARIVMSEREQVALEVMLEGANGPELSFARWGVPADQEPVMPKRGDRVIEAVSADVLVSHGDRLDVPGRDIRVVLTPGHTPGHICLHDELQGLVFTGDHVLPTVHPGLGLGGPTDRSPIAEYFESLDRIRVFDGDEVLPGHGYRFRGLEERVAATEAHHRKRAAEVAAVLAELPGASVWEVASRVRWTAGWENLQGFLRISALAQTEMHMRYLAGD